MKKNILSKRKAKKQIKKSYEIQLKIAKNCVFKSGDFCYAGRTKEKTTVMCPFCKLNIICVVDEIMDRKKDRKNGKA